MAKTAAQKAATRRLKRYWTIGPGGAKIRWGTRGDFRRCVKQTRKYLGPNVKGYCSNLHKRATGKRPGRHRSRRRKR